MITPSAALRSRVTTFSTNAFKLGLFGLNCSGGLTMTKAADRWDASWENNFRPGFFPGSGTQDGYQIQGRFEFGDRTFAVQFVVRVQAGSTEYSNLINLTTGTATFTMTRDTNNSFTMLIQKMGFNVAELGNTDGIVTLQITGVQLYDATNGLVTVTVTTPQTGICQ